MHNRNHGFVNQICLFRYSNISCLHIYSMTTCPIYSIFDTFIYLLRFQTKNVSSSIQLNKMSVSLTIPLEVLDLVSSKSWKRKISFFTSNSLNLACLHILHLTFTLIIIHVILHQNIFGSQISGLWRYFTFIGWKFVLCHHYFRLLACRNDFILLKLVNTEIKKSLFRHNKFKMLSFTLVPLNI